MHFLATTFLCVSLNPLRKCSLVLLELEDNVKVM